MDKSNMQILFDNHEYLYEVRTTVNTKYKIGISVKDGIKYLNIREFYRKHGAEYWSPSNRGILMPYNKRVKDEDGHFETINIAGDVLNAALEIEKHLATFPIYNADNTVWVEKRSSKKKKDEEVKNENSAEED